MLLICCKQFYASLDKSVRLEMLLCSWKPFNANFNGYVQLEMLLCSWKRFYESLDKSVWQETLLCSWKRFYASLGESVPQGIFFSDYLLAGTSFWIFPPKLEQEWAEPFFVSMLWWLITQPRPIWKKASPGLQRHPIRSPSEVWLLVP